MYLKSSKAVSVHDRKFDGTTGGAGVNDFRPLTAPGGFGPDTKPVDQIRRMGSPPPDQGAFRWGLFRELTILV